MASTIKDYVLRFKISTKINSRNILPVDYTISMETFEGANDLCCIDSRSFLREFHILAQMPEQLSPVQKIHDEVELVLRLKSIIKIDDVRILYLFHNFSFSYLRSFNRHLLPLVLTHRFLDAIYSFFSTFMAYI